MSTAIEWTDEVWNPVTGCSKVSAGCRHCYAETIATRFWGTRPFEEVRCHPERLDIPLHWKQPRKVFVNSMSDLFHEDIPATFMGNRHSWAGVSSRALFGPRLGSSGKEEPVVYA